MKTWKPDTCDCKVEEIYNGTEIVGMGEIINKCSAHQSVPDEELYEVIYGNVVQGIYGENRIKNQVVRVLLGYESIKDLGLEEDKFNPDGSYAGKGLKEGMEYKWYFEGEGKNRVLKWEVIGADLTQKQIDDIQTVCAEKVEPAKLESVHVAVAEEVIS